MHWYRQLLVVGLFLVAGESLADKEKAKELFKKGMLQYKLDHYDDAISTFEAAYAEEPSPVFLFNIAQAHRLARHPRPALEFYRKYLKDAPDAKNKQSVDEQIAQLEIQIKQQDEEAEKAKAAAEVARAAELARTPPSAATQPPAEGGAGSSAAKKRWPLWVGIAAGALVVVGAGVATALVLGRPGEPQLPLENAR